MNLTEVILEEGKKLHCSEAITLEELAFPFGTYPITKKSPFFTNIILCLLLGDLISMFYLLRKDSHC